MDDQLPGIHLYPQTNPSQSDIYQKQQGKEEKINVSGELSVLPMELMIFKSSKDYFSCNLSYTKL